MLLNKHQLKTEATKAKLFQAARRVFARRGLEAATIDQIARTAGFSRGAFYAHFKTKEDLFLGMLEDHAAADFTFLRDQMASNPREAWAGILWEVCVARMRDVQWAMLQIEFKLYIARRGTRGAKLAERFHTLRENMRRQYLEDLIPKEAETHIIFEALMDGLSLQRAYKGARLSGPEAERVLRRAFDLLLGEQPFYGSTGVK